MIEAPAFLTETIHRVLSGSRYRRYTYRVLDGRIHYNAFGTEAVVRPAVGTVVAQDEEWVILKIRATEFSAHKKSLLPVPVSDGDRVEIQHNGFNGSHLEQGPGYATLSRKHLEFPTDNPYLKDLARQLTGMKAKDGRRGLHVLHDLEYGNVSVDDTDEYFPVVSFDVKGGKFSGRLSIRYQKSSDDYLLSFEGENAPEPIDGLYFDDIVDAIEGACDSSHKKIASVRILKKAKAPAREGAAS